jgi:hypothetical protein
MLLMVEMTPNCYYAAKLRSDSFQDFDHTCKISASERFCMAGKLAECGRPGRSQVGQAGD